MSYGSRKRGYDQGGCVRGVRPPSPVYNVEPVTNTSSSSCENNERRTPPWVLGSTPSVAALFHTSRLVRLITLWEVYAAKPNTRPESRFLPTPPAVDAPVREVSVGILSCLMVWKKYKDLATRRWKNVEDMFIRFNRMYERHRQTDGHRMTA